MMIRLAALLLVTGCATEPPVVEPELVKTPVTVPVDLTGCPGPVPVPPPPPSPRTAAQLVAWANSVDRVLLETERRRRLCAVRLHRLNNEIEAQAEVIRP